MYHYFIAMFTRKSTATTTTTTTSNTFCCCCHLLTLVDVVVVVAAAKGWSVSFGIGVVAIWIGIIVVVVVVIVVDRCAGAGGVVPALFSSWECLQLFVLSNSLAFPYPPNPGEHVLKRFATATGKQDFTVKWFKFINPSPKPRMTETPVQKPVHVAYSPIASMNYQWTINLHGGYPLLHGMQPEECIPPSLHTLCNHKPTMFHLGDDYLCPSKILLPLTVLLVGHSYYLLKKKGGEI